MDVSLERVQFKFASIIGELCSQPIVLSQFAVWVDLRLAEYKLKGSFSLDCSGETPDPGWMKGIKSALLAQKLLLAASQNATKPSGHGYKGSPTRMSGGLSRTGRSAMSHPPRAPVSQRPMVRLDKDGDTSESLQSPVHIVNTQSQEEIRLSPDIVVKEEPSCDQDVYPISLHVHEEDNESRKRTAAGTSENESDGHIYHDVESSSSKIRRTSSSQHEAPSNESLMSIIGLGDQSQDDEDDSISVENINSDIDFIMAAEIAQNTKREINQMGPNSTMTSPGGQSFTPTPSTSGSPGASANRNESSARRYRSQGSALGYSQRKGVSNSTSGLLDPYRVKIIDRRIRCHVKRFELWKQAEPYNDARAMETIPPAELDGFLVKFFSSVKMQSGGDFSRHSLKKMRTSLESYLKAQNYPLSITNSVEFFSSTFAFKERLHSLTH